MTTDICESGPRLDHWTEVGPQALYVAELPHDHRGHGSDRVHGDDDDGDGRRLYLMLSDRFTIVPQ